MGLLDAIFGNNQPPKINSILPTAAKNEIRAGRLPILNTDSLFLKRGEKIHYIDKAINLEIKVVKQYRHVGHSTPGLLKGNRWNVGVAKPIEHTIESLNVERLEQMINLVISKNDVLRLIVTHEGKASFLDNVPYYSVPIYSLYDENVREQKRLERSHHRYNYYKWPMLYK